ncbi:hypothetical protein [Rummeliibacillus stabekisii]|uniref:HNH nuclease domain-containing protein n=1 Tax=Rummeliibacillus stabekisii TaxID=241244 RepID=A0A143HE58_9BACL|nr:hypothetical protein [Rummeliibacillus stabekisii]AMW99770.1 hypothetical protein ATY39_10165 [Rummeliibacillus stabekisii]
MIYVKRIECPDTLNLSNIESDAYKELGDVIEYLKVKDRDFKFNAYGKPNVKEQLARMFNNKCAYCESKISPVSYGDIEHFRPKTAYHSIDGENLIYPGYYWLAMDWNNLLLSCEVCNRSYKKNKFPLIDENKRKKRHDDEVIEDPLIIDPCHEEMNPKDYIFFTEEGIIKYKDGEGGKGEKSIQIYGLSRPNLTDNRKILAKELEDKKIQILGYLNTISTLIEFPNPKLFREIIESNLKDLEAVYNSLKKSNLPSEPYLGMVRNLTSDFLEKTEADIEFLLAKYKELTSNRD